MKPVAEITSAPEFNSAVEVNLEKSVAEKSVPAEFNLDADSTSVAAENYVSPYGKSFTKNMWYFAASSGSLKRGQKIAKSMLNEPILIGRDNEGKVFAMRDICPHQAVPLSAGHFDGKEVECPFHGWRFDTKGVCSDIPSLCSDQKMNLCGIKTRSYICAEVLDSIWVYFGDKTTDLPEVPHAPGLTGLKYAKTTTTLLLPTHIDFAVAALIDTAHVPFVHTSWWWRAGRNLKEKAKKYVPSGTGWTMVKHTPSPDTPLFKLIGKYIETEISFRLPGCRREYLSYNNQTKMSGITTLTPIDDTHTELNHTTYWTWWPGLTQIASPIVNYFVTTFLMQDQTLALMQEKIISTYNPRLIMTIKDAGTPGHWYFMAKKEWNDAYEQGRAFVNPIKEKILRWRT